MGPLCLRVRDCGVQGLTSGDADSGGLVRGGHSEVEGSRETVVPPWQVNVSRAPGCLLLITGASWEQEAGLFELRAVYSSFIVAELEDLVTDAIVPDSSVPPSRTLTTVVPSVVEDRVTEWAKFAGILIHAQPVLELHNILSGRHSEPKRRRRHNIPEVLCPILAFRN